MMSTDRMPQLISQAIPTSIHEKESLSFSFEGGWVTKDTRDLAALSGRCLFSCCPHQTRVHYALRSGGGRGTMADAATAVRRSDFILRLFEFLVHPSQLQTIDNQAACMNTQHHPHSKGL